MKTFAILTAALPMLALAAPMNDGKKSGAANDGHGQKNAHQKYLNDGVFDFTSTYYAKATPDQVVNNVSVPTPGLEGAVGYYFYGINAPQEIICWNITLENFNGNYSSPAKTATHIHEAAFGRNGPPRIAFPNPTITGNVDERGRRVSVGCQQGPFTTGLAPNGTDTGTGFSLSQIEANPPGFFTDVHTSAFPAGAVRGQLDLTGSVY